MKERIRRFVDWMQNGPALLTVWFMPALLVIFVIAWGINKYRDLTKGYIHTK